MPKHAAHRKVTARRAHPARPRHAGKVIPVKAPAAPKIPVPAVTNTLEPNPRVIEVIELDFVDPDIALDEEALVTGFDDEDF